MNKDVTVLKEVDKTSVVFRMATEYFCVPAAVVEEILWLPELSVIEEVPAHVAGVVDLRGDLVPVVDLMQAFGHPAIPFNQEDCVVVLRTTEGVIGVIVNEVLSVEPIQDVASDALKRTGAVAHIVRGEARVNDKLVMVLDHENLMSLMNGASVNELLGGEEAAPTKALIPARYTGSLDVFKARATALKETKDGVSTANVNSVSIIRIGREMYGVELASLREFADRRHITQVPCTPGHIVGNMNLRGDIVTVMDMRVLLNIGSDQDFSGEQLMVVDKDGLMVGILVDEVVDVVFVDMALLSPPPASLEDDHADFILGETPYGRGMATILDLPQILNRQEFIVDEPL